MSKITLHIHPFSQPSQAIMLLVSHFKCDDKVEYKLVDLTAGAHLTPEFLAVNPYHSIPVLQYGNLTLYESPAILQYLAELFHWEGDYGFPTDPEGTWNVINSLHKHHNIIRNKTVSILRPWMATFFSKGKIPFDKDMMVKGLKESKRDWKALDSVLAKNDGFLTGKPTVADVLAFTELFRLTKDKDHNKDRSLAIYDFDEHPNVKKWLETVGKTFLNDHQSWKDVSSVVKKTKKMMPAIVLLE